ncbi:MAG: oligosaccharide flippase family protein [Bacteroidales bacterium]|nr:oligosaccharide flippase family protein [Bacteroidales bacterium]
MVLLWGTSVFFIWKRRGVLMVFFFSIISWEVFGFLCFHSSIIAFSEELAQMLVGSKDQSVNLQITLGIIVVEILYVLPLQVLQYEKKAFSYLSYNALKLVISFATTIYFVINLDMGITGFLTARLIGVSIVIIIAVFHIIIPRCTFAFSKYALMQSLRFGFPHVISTLGYTVFSITDRFMLNWLSTPEELGKYGFGFRIANFINLIFVQTIGMSYFPSIMNNEKEVDNIRYYRKMLTYYSFLIGFLILGFLFFYSAICYGLL